MKPSDLIFESHKPKDYLNEIPPLVTFHSPLVQEQIEKIQAQTKEPYVKAKLAFEFVRDKIQHSFDIESHFVSITAEETLQNKEGICFAKTHLLAALLRGMHFPTGFCYQKVLKGKNPGYALHGLNAVFIGHIGWFRVDPRGNKPGVDSQFTTIEEKLAYPIRTELGEIDYPYVFTRPLDAVIASMKNSPNCSSLFNNRPSDIFLPKWANPQV